MKSTRRERRGGSKGKTVTQPRSFVTVPRILVEKWPHTLEAKNKK
jgi:hypothetical protein